VVDLRLRSTAWAYAKSWFVVDCTLVILDWSLLLITHVVSFGGVFRSTKTLRFWRALKMLKFLRWYRMPKLYLNTYNFLRTDLAQTTLTIVSWILGLLTLSHLIACFWYFIGKAEESPSWVLVAQELYMQQSHGREPGDWYLYLTALHWAMTQFTPASMEVSPRNLWERLYNLAVILVSLVLFPTCLTSITNCVAAFRKKNSDYRDARRDLSQYLQDNHISLDLSTRIQSVAFAQYENKRTASRIHEPDVSLLKLLPRSLKEQLHAQLYLPTVIKHPILSALGTCHDRTLVKICDEAMSQGSLEPAEELFAFGKEAEQMYFVVSGCLFYWEGPLPSPNMREEVSSGEWICDQVLWMPWVHRGQMTGFQPSELANLDASIFLKIVDQRSMIRAMCCHFAHCYLAAIVDDELAGACNDLGCATAKLQDMVNIVKSPSISSSRSS